MKPPIAERTLYSISIWACYGVALRLPALDLPSSGGGGSIDVHGPIIGWGALIMGWIPPLCIPWSGNLLLLIGWILYLYGKGRAALACGGAALLLGATTVAFGWGPSAMRWGFAFWELSFAILAFAGWQASRQVYPPPYASVGIDRAGEDGP